MLVGILASVVAWGACEDTLSLEVVRARVTEAADLELAAGHDAHEAVACLGDWIDPALAAQVHQLRAQLAVVDDDPDTLPTAYTLGMQRALSPPADGVVRVLPDRGVCLWRVDGWPADGGRWIAQPGAAAIVQRRCGDSVLQTWLVDDERIPAEALVVGGPWPLPAPPVVLARLPEPPQAPVDAPMPVPELGRPPLTAPQQRLLWASAGSAVVGVAALTAAGILRAQYISGAGDPDVLTAWNGATGSLGYGASVASVGLLLRFEDLRRVAR